MKHVTTIVAVCMLAICGGCGDVNDSPVDVGAFDVADVAMSTNVCGGSVVLSAVLGELCGECLDGRLACDGPNRLTCDGATQTRNSCGVCEPLAGVVGDPCGCAGTFACDGPRLVCANDSAANACGGCDALAPYPAGQTCEGDGIAVCASPNETVCRRAALNACGGTGALTAQPEVEAGSLPGDPCGSCGRGVVRCAAVGGDVLECADAELGVNACGGCDALEEEIGAACGCGGTWACGSEGVVCDGGREANACGGCGELDATPGDVCDDGVVGCSGRESTRCVDTVAPCGTEAFGPLPGSPCGTCDSGSLVCVSATVNQCTGVSPRNACGGCGLLAGEPETTCGAGRLWRCLENGQVACIATAAHNVCGGTAPLNGAPGDTCGACGDAVLICSGTEAIVCVGEDTTNPCGGCSVLEGTPGTPCGLCNSGTWQCNGPDELHCDGEDAEAEFLSYPDIDGDGYGGGGPPQSVCPNLPGWVRNDLDCNDTAPATYPGADELCDESDNDCDGVEDEDFFRWPDLDGDGLGADQAPTVICVDTGEWVDNSLDCYDNNAGARPGQTQFFEFDRGDGSYDYDCDGIEQLAFPDEPQCGVAPLACNFVPSGLVRGFQAPVPGCGDDGEWLRHCLPADDGCEMTFFPAIQTCR